MIMKAAAFPVCRRYPAVSHTAAAFADKIHSKLLKGPKARMIKAFELSFLAGPERLAPFKKRIANPDRFSAITLESQDFGMVGKTKNFNTFPSDRYKIPGEWQFDRLSGDIAHSYRPGRLALLPPVKGQPFFPP